jgi:hypothetical protein
MYGDIIFPRFCFGLQEVAKNSSKNKASIIVWMILQKFMARTNIFAKKLTTLFPVFDYLPNISFDL